MYPNLNELLRLRKVNKKQLAELLDNKVNTVSEKLNGKLPFSHEEALKILKTYFPNYTVEYLFDKGEKYVRYSQDQQQQMLQLALSIPIPPETVLINKVELNELYLNQLKGTYWTMTELEKRIKRNQRWIKERILMNPEFRRQLDVDYGGFVYYPQHQGEKWAFQATKMANFLDDNFYAIFRTK